MTSTREDINATVEKTGAALLDHGHHVVELGRKQAEAAAKASRKRAEATAKAGRKRAEAAAKQARKRSAAAWSDFADEAGQRAANVIAAGRGDTVAARRRSKTPWLLAVAGGVAALLVVMRVRGARVLQPVPVVPTDLPAAPDIAPSTESSQRPNGATVSRARHLG